MKKDLSFHLDSPNKFYCKYMCELVKSFFIQKAKPERLDALVESIMALTRINGVLPQNWEWVQIKIEEVFILCVEEYRIMKKALSKALCDKGILKESPEYEKMAYSMTEVY